VRQSHIKREIYGIPSARNILSKSRDVKKLNLNSNDESKFKVNLFAETQLQNKTQNQSFTKMKDRNQ
jgi:hypothetical protein